MCTTRSWLRLDINEAFGIIFAKRSDNVVIQLYNLEFNSATEFAKRLEEFRNCKCLPNAPCNKHLEEKERVNANT